DASADPHLGDASVADEELDRAPPVEAVAGHVDGHRVPIGLAVPRNVDDLEMRALADVVRPVPFAYAVVPAELATPVVQVGVIRECGDEAIRLAGVRRIDELADRLRQLLCRHRQATPPLANRTCPLIHRAGPARNAATVAMSSGRPRRSRGGRAASRS